MGKTGKRVKLDNGTPSKEHATSASAEIDQLFERRLTERPPKDDQKDDNKGKAAIKDQQKKNTKKTRMRSIEHDSVADTRGTKKTRNLTKDGLPIYTAEEMGIGRGGETADCPFDCSCCF